MTDNEIIKALSICYDDSLGGCEKCPYYGKWLSCGELKAKDALDLIKRQQEEIEKLQRRIVFWREDMDYRPERERAEAIKEFVEKFKEHFEIYTDAEESMCIYVKNIIDSLVKEMTDR